MTVDDGICDASSGLSVLVILMGSLKVNTSVFVSSIGVIVEVDPLNNVAKKVSVDKIVDTSTFSDVSTTTIGTFSSALSVFKVGIDDEEKESSCQLSDGCELVEYENEVDGTTDVGSMIDVEVNGMSGAGALVVTGIVTTLETTCSELLILEVSSV